MKKGMAKDLAKAVAAAGLANQTPLGVAASPAAMLTAQELKSTIRLTLDQVDFFERNPRHKRNQKYLEIKASIKARGLDHNLHVTRRPGSKRYLLSKGGRTRYSILRELWEETKDRKFYELDFIYEDYKGEVDLLAGHLSENLNRDDMCFWDKAKGYVDMKQEIEQNLGGLTYEQVIDQFKANGIPDVSRSLLALYQFAFDKLEALGQGAFNLTMLAVRSEIQPGYNFYLRLVKLAPAQIEFDSQVWSPALTQFDNETSEIEWATLAGSIEASLAGALGMEPEALQKVLHALKLAGNNPDLTWDQLLPAPPPSSPPPGGEAAGGTPGTQNSGNGVSEDEDPEETEEEQTAGAEPQASVRVRQTPSTFARKEPTDSDRPPAGLVAQVEADQRARATQETEEKPPTPLRPTPLDTAPTTGGVDREKQVIYDLVVQLAAHSRTLDSLILRDDRLPLGWLVDLPAEVLAGTPLAPLARQLFWFLARVSFQIHTGMHQPERISGTRFGQFLAAGPTPEQWALVQPEGGFDFLMSWLIDPAHIAFAMPVTRILFLTRDLVANNPEHFLDLGHTLEFADLQENQQAERHEREQEDLAYFVDNGASPEMVRRLFHSVDTGALRFRPGRIAEIDLRTAQRLFNVWEDLTQEIASDRQRFLRLHQMFPETSMASLWSAIHDLG
jgi:ParB family protein of integrating conjugative element (PFGI_1 class)